MGRSADKGAVDRQGNCGCRAGFDMEGHVDRAEANRDDSDTAFYVPEVWSRPVVAGGCPEGRVEGWCAETQTEGNGAEKPERQSC